MDSPYLHRAADHPLQDAAPGLRVREAVTPFGVALRYQFGGRSVETGPGDMLHIPAGPGHRRQPSVLCW